MSKITIEMDVLSYCDCIWLEMWRDILRHTSIRLLKEKEQGRSLDPSPWGAESSTLT